MKSLGFDTDIVYNNSWIRKQNDKNSSDQVFVLVMMIVTRICKTHQNQVLINNIISQ